MSAALPPLEFAWPSRILHPNARRHWGQRSSSTKKARIAGAITARAAGLRKITAERLLVTAIFTPPDNRARDLDGMMSSIKPTLDGIADALGVNDSRFELTMRREPPRAPGAVRIEIEVAS